MLKKLLVICGPTATGKTKLACELARIFKGEIVSADSRQVYKYMDVGTGKDLYPYTKSSPAGELKLSIKRPRPNKVNSGLDKSIKIRNTNLNVCYLISNIPLWGYDLTEPDRDFDVSQYFNIAGKFVTNIWHREKLPIIVGGSGLYIKALIDGFETISVPPSEKLRKILDKKKPEQLFELLKVLDSNKTNSMNESDRKNPRRLIRAIEIASDNIKTKNKISSTTNKLNHDSLLIIGLTSSRQYINRRITKRVKERIGNGFNKELQELLRRGVDWRYKSMQGIGYRQYEKYYKKTISWRDFVNNWTVEEQKYAKRQMTWFKKDKRINWIEISERNWKYKVEKLVRSWYYE